MKKLFYAFAAVAILASLAFTLHVDSLPIGSSLPKGDIKMKNVLGKDVSIKDQVKSNGVLVMFSCNTCPYVIKNQGRTHEIGAYALKNNIGVILLNPNEGQRTSDDSYEAMQAYAKDQKYAFPYTIDAGHVIADAFGATRTPEVFLFNKELNLVYHGAIDDNPGDASNVKKLHLKNAIDEMVAGKAVTVTETRSVGCTIKRIK